MIEKDGYTYWLYYYNNEIYAYTDNKKYAKKFEEIRDMNKLKKVKKKISKEELNYLADAYQDRFLKTEIFKVYDKYNMKYYDMEIILSTVESITVSNYKVRLSTIDLFNNCAISPKYFGEDIVKALKCLGYQDLHLMYEGHDELANQSTIPKPDSLGIFLYYYGWSIKNL